MESANPATSVSKRGWRGDSERHAKAGRTGGLRGRKKHKDAKRAKWQREYYARNKDKVRARIDAWRKAHWDDYLAKARVRSKAWYQRNKVRLAKLRKAKK